MQNPTPGTTLHIALVRHGRSAHVHRGWIDAAGFRSWRAAYEAAGLHPHERAPAELVALAAGAARIVASDAPRALESARLLAPGCEVIASPLLRELDLEAPNFGALRLPLFCWALAVGARAQFRTPCSRAAFARERARVAAAADWLAVLAAAGAPLVAVTHAQVRRQLAVHLAAGGWQADAGRRTLQPWSAWRFSRA